MLEWFKFGEGALRFSLNLSKCSYRFTNIFLITLYPFTPAPVHNSTFLYDGGLVLGGHQEVLDGIASFEVYLYTMLAANVLETFTEPSSVRYHHVNVDFLIVVGFLLVVVMYLVLCSILVC